MTNEIDGRVAVISAVAVQYLERIDAKTRSDQTMFGLAAPIHSERDRMSSTAIAL